jgi:hypothetical protein
VTHFNFTNGSAAVEVYLVFYEPSSGSAYKTCGVVSNTYCSFTTPVSGTRKVVLVPYEASVGSLTLKLT